MFAAALGWIALRNQSPPTDISAGVLVGTKGPVRSTSGTAGAPVVDGDPLRAGAIVETGRAGAALVAIAEDTVRIGADSLVKLAGPLQIDLLRGRLYLDAGRVGRDARSVAVGVPRAIIRHVGTQFQATVGTDRSVSVSVREGRVLLDRSAGTEAMAAGEGVRLDESGTMSRFQVEPYDASWRWVSDFVPEFPIDGRKLSDFLDWFSRETGRKIVFELPATRADTERTLLSGSASGLSPVEALDAVLTATRYQYDAPSSGEIRIRVRTTDHESPRTTASPIPSTAAAAH